MTGSKKTTPIKKSTKRERRILIVALVIVPFIYPFLLFWFAQAQLDKMCQRAEALPDRLRAVAPPNSKCHQNPDKLKADARSVLAATGGALPNGSADTLRSLKLFTNVKFLPAFSRSYEVWYRIIDSNDRLYAVWKNPKNECEHAGKKLHQAAADLEVALASYKQTRILLQILRYSWLVAEIFGWIVVIYFTRRFFRERAEAKASSQSSDRVSHK